ncbi:MAG: GWxTD domain-containing protein [Flavobacteriales bacterium]
MKIKSFHISLLLLAFFFGFLTSCTNGKLLPRESNYQYDSKLKDLNPNYLVYHVNDTLSYLYLEIASKELLYVRENSKQPFESEVRIKLEIYEDYKGKMLIDSSSQVLYDYKTPDKNKRILARIPLNMPIGDKGILKVTANDVNKKIKSESVIEIDKRDRLSPQFFLVREKVSNNLCFDTYISSFDSLVLESEYNKEGTYMVDYFNTDYPASIPPFSKNKLIEIPNERDSLFVLSIENGKGEMSLNRKGSYFIRSVDSTAYNLTFQKLDSNFSSFSSYAGMIEPLKYICTSTEYSSLERASNQREAVEKFWLKIGRTKERSRVIIAEYYRRVELANKFFTSYKEGWKTDRGMLSIVMGLPNTIYKTNTGETWIYGTPNNMMMSLTFNFNKQNTDKDKNDYQLVRYRTYRDYWYRACESWRQGRIYNYN